MMQLPGLWLQRIHLTIYRALERVLIAIEPPVIYANRIVGYTRGIRRVEPIALPPNGLLRCSPTESPPERTDA